MARKQQDVGKQATNCCNHNATDTFSASSTDCHFSGMLEVCIPKQWDTNMCRPHSAVLRVNRLLLESKASPDEQNNMGDTAMHEVGDDSQTKTSTGISA